ncbi:MAG: YraN family protein [Lentisphaeria bacterium]|nr:YraN family protein [Lentisphaeria bacterium]
MTLFRRARKAHLRLGRRGENAACRLLRSYGWEILARNWRCRYGELDLVARDGAVIVFVEVKTRHYRPDRRPSDNLSLRQYRRNVRAGKAFCRDFRWEGSRRYELIEVEASLRKLRKIRRRILPGV